MGTPFRFIHCGDLHLGAPFSYLKSLGKIGDEAVLEATYMAFRNIVDIVVEERVDALLISGDIYNSSDHNLSAQVKFVQELERVSAKGIPVFIVHGNHDPLSEWKAKIPFPKGVHVFSSEKVERVPLLVRGKEVAAVYGISHGVKNITENLALRFERDSKDEYAIGLLHAMVAGTEGSAYAPCSLEDLKQGGMDYWALGHIHKREVLSEDPFIVYPGNPQGLKRSESGPRGCYMVQVSNSGHTELTFMETSALRFQEEVVSINNLTMVAEIAEMIRHKRELLRTKVRKPVLLSLVLTGQGKLAEACHNEEVRDMWLLSAQEEEKSRGSFVIPYEINDQTMLPLDLKERRKLPDILGDYLATYDGVATLEEEERLTALRGLLENRPEAKRLGKYTQFLTNDIIEKALRRAEQEGALRIVGDSHEDY